MDTILPSQPSTYSQIILTSLRLYRKSFSHCILLSLALAFTVFIPRFLILFVGQDIFWDLSVFSLHRLWILAINLVCLTFFIGIIWRMNCVLRGKHEPLIEDISIGLKKLVYVFLASILQSGIVFAVFLTGIGLQILLVKHNLIFNNNLIVALITFIVFFGQLILILYISTLFIFLIPLIAVENKGVIGSLKRSMSLVWNHWWRIFSVQITPWLMYAVILLVIRYILNINIHIYFTEVSEKTIWPAIMHVILFALYIPLFAATLLVQLKDLELRKKLLNRHKL